MNVKGQEMSVAEYLGKVATHEMVTHPVAFLMGCVVVLFLAEGGVGSTLTPFALRGDVETQQTKFKAHIQTAERQFIDLQRAQCALTSTIEVRWLEGQLRSIEQEKWSLEGLVQDRNASTRDRDRLGRVLSDQRELMGRKAAIEQTRCTQSNISLPGI